jgi:hypothetical protein
VAVKYDVDGTISDAETYRQTLKYNAANLFIVPTNYEANRYTSAYTPIYDELAIQESSPQEKLFSLLGARRRGSGYIRLRRKTHA